MRFMAAGLAREFSLLPLAFFGGGCAELKSEGPQRARGRRFQAHREAGPTHTHAWRGRGPHPAGEETCWKHGRTGHSGLRSLCARFQGNRECSGRDGGKNSRPPLLPPEPSRTVSTWAASAGFTGGEKLADPMRWQVQLFCKDRFLIFRPSRLPTGPE